MNSLFIIINIDIIIHLDFICPDSSRLTKEVIKINAGDSLTFNTNPDGGDS